MTDYTGPDDRRAMAYATYLRKKLNEHRISLHVLYRRLAEDWERQPIDISSLSKFRSGKRLPSAINVIRIGQVLGADDAEIVGLILAVDKIRRERKTR